MVVQMAAENITGVDSHGAIDEDRDIGKLARVLQAIEMKQKALRPANREGWDDNSAATCNRAVNDFQQRLLGTTPIMLPIAVGGLHDQIVGVIAGNRVQHGCAVIAAEIPGED